MLSLPGDERHVAQISNQRAEALSAAAPLTVHRRHDAGTLTIALRGELDLATAHMLKRELDDLAHTNPGAIVLDLRKLEFIDGTGLHVIFKAHRRTGPQLLILKGPARVQRAFELCGLEELLTFVDEIPVHNVARRAQQAAVAAAVRELCSPARLRAVR